MAGTSAGEASVFGTDAPPLAIAPFSADQAKAHQEAWAKYLGMPIEYTNSIGIKFRLIPPGEFLMGTPEAELSPLSSAAPVFKNEGPQHRVSITQPFLMGTCEVTRGQFRAFVEDTEYQTDAEKSGGTALINGQQRQDRKFNWRTNCGFEQTDDHPVMNVSWNDASAFCKWLSEKEGVLYRLPTEAEWEYACRAGTTTRIFGIDDSELSDYGWNRSNSGGKTHPVGEKKPNPWSLYDIYGNV